MIGIGDLVAWIVLGFTILQFFIALSNALFPETLPEIATVDARLVSVLIPARNEAHRIGNLLEDLGVQQEIPMEIVVYDDQSDDHTGEEVLAYQKKDPRIRLLQSEGLPVGWLGKNHACDRLAQEARGDFFLFLDADVRIKGLFIRHLVGYAKRNHCDLVSVFPQQHLVTWAEYATVPLMHFILLSLLPLPLVRLSRNSAFAAANGQVMLFDARVCRAERPHFYARQFRAEDIHIARFFKRKRRRIACLLGDPSINCRMYTHYSEALKGFSKNIVDMLCHSHLFAWFFVLTTGFGFLPVFLFLPNTWFYLYLVLYFGIRFLVARSAHQSLIKTMLMVPCQQISLLLILIRHEWTLILGKEVWKDRNILSSS